MIKAVLWDMDGVIADTGEFHFAAWKRLLRDKGIDLTEDLFKRTFGMRNAEIIKTFLGADVSEADIKSLARRKEVYFRDFLRDHVSANPGATRLIRELHTAGILQAIASSAPMENIGLIVDSLRIREYFQTIVGESDVTVGKPDPQVFLLAASRLGVEPSRCVVIEDAVPGIQAAKAGGMKCIALAATHPPERLVGADLIVRSLDDLTVDEVIGLGRSDD